MHDLDLVESGDVDGLYKVFELANLLFHPIDADLLVHEDRGNRQFEDTVSDRLPLSNSPQKTLLLDRSGGGGGEWERRVGGGEEEWEGEGEVDRSGGRMGGGEE